MRPIRLSLSYLEYSCARLSAVAALLLLVACQSDRIGGPSFSISDGAHSGNRNFFFLPPLVGNPVNLPGYDASAFDATQDPAVEICLLSGNVCAPTQPSGFPIRYTMQSGPGGEVIRVIPADQHYLVNWAARDFHLDASSFYRIRVLVAGTELGYADVDVVSNGSDLRSVNTNQYIGLVDGRTLPIKFRIERGAVAVLAIQELVAVRDALAVRPPVVISIKESVAVRDQVSALPPVVIALREAVKVTDQPRVLPAAQVRVNESVVVRDEPRVLGAARVDVREVVAVSDQDRVIPGVSVQVRETIQVSDAARALPAASVKVAEQVTVSDANRVLPPAEIRVAEAVRVADAPKVLPPVVIDVNERVGVGDGSRVLPPVTVAVREMVGVSDQLRVLPPVSISVTESIRVTDAAEVTRQ